MIATFSPRVYAMADDLFKALRHKWRFQRKEAAALLGGTKTTDKALRILMAQGRVEKLKRGVYRAVRPEEGTKQASEGHGLPAVLPGAYEAAEGV